MVICRGYSLLWALFGSTAVGLGMNLGKQCWVNGCFQPKNRGGVKTPPKIIPFVHRGWNHYFHHPFWGVKTPYFWKHPNSGFPNVFCWKPDGYYLIKAVCWTEVVFGSKSFILEMAWKLGSAVPAHYWLWIGGEISEAFAHIVCIYVYL